MEPTQPDDGDARAGGDLLVGAAAIRRFLNRLGWPVKNDDDVYYLKRAGWPIGNTAGDAGGKIISTERKIRRHIEKMTRGPSAA
jgi:hypothetical protein